MADVADETTRTVDGAGNGNADGINPDPGEGAGGDTGSGTGDKSGSPESGTDFDVSEILDEYGLESPAELKEFIGGLNEMRGKVGDADLDELIENSNTLKKFQSEWAKQEREKLKESETPEETIARLEKENEQLANKRKSDRQKMAAAESAKKAIEGFNSTVNAAIEGAKDVPKSWRPFIAKFMGVNNPVNEIDIEDRATVRRLTKDGVKEMSKFAQAVIKDYRDGKVKIPEIASPQSPPSDSSKPKGAKNLSDARRIMHESMAALLK